MNTQNMRNIILDCDPGEDDALAILVAMQNKLPLHYIVASHGNSTVDNATKNASRILSFTNYLDVKVIKGSPKPLKPHLHKPDGYTAGDFVGTNGICGVKLPASKVKNIINPTEDTLPKFLTDIIKKEAPLDYIITGPSTNFAKVCKHLGSDIHKYIKNIYMMGGAFHTPGNSGPINPETGKGYAEFNFYCDPNAVSIVLSSGLPVHLITWDITSTLTVSEERFLRLTNKTKTGKFTTNLMRHFFNNYGREHLRHFELNDPITIMAQLGYGHYREEKIKIVTDGKEYGQSIQDTDGFTVKYFYLEDSEKFEIIEAVLKSLDLA